MAATNSIVLNGIKVRLFFNLREAQALCNDYTEVLGNQHEVLPVEGQEGYLIRNTVTGALYDGSGKLPTVFKL